MKYQGFITLSRIELKVVYISAIISNTTFYTFLFKFESFIVIVRPLFS